MSGQRERLNSFEAGKGDQGQRTQHYTGNHPCSDSLNPQDENHPHSDMDGFPLHHLSSSIQVSRCGVGAHQAHLNAVIGKPVQCAQCHLVPATNNAVGHQDTVGADFKNRVIFNAVTGANFTFADGMELGRKIFNLDRAIWVLQGRHQDQEVFNPWMYKPDTNAAGTASIKAPIWDGSKWEYQEVKDMFLDRDGFEQWKTKFYKLEGWDPKNGWPGRSTLAKLGLTPGADELASKGKLGDS